MDLKDLDPYVPAHAGGEAWQDEPDDEQAWATWSSMYFEPWWSPDGKLVLP